MKAYSYIRWSSAQQSLGDSLRRQLELAERYAAKHNLNLDTKLYRDAGVSAFKGKNLENSLGTFLLAIDNGQIATPSMLLVEALDRITREEIDTALELFLSIIKRGVTIVVLQSDQIFSKETIKKDRGISLIIAISMLVQGHEESAKRGHRIRESWVGKMQKAKTDNLKLSANCPSWLKLTKERTGFIVIKEKADVVRRIYKLALEHHGALSICKILNAEKVKPIGHRVRTDAKGKPIPLSEWSEGNISFLMKSHAVYGRYKPSSGKCDIPGYYKHAIVAQADYDAVQRIRSKHKYGGRSHGVGNLFSSLTHCAYCKSKMKISGGAKKRRKGSTLRCLKSIQGGGCNARAIRYDVLESELMSYIVSWSKRDLSGYKLDESNKSAVMALDQRLAEKIEELKNLRAVARHAKRDPVGLAEDMDEVQGEIDAIQAEMVALKQGGLNGEQLAGLLEQIEATSEWMYDVMEERDMNARLKVQAVLRQIIKRIEVATYLETYPKFHEAFNIEPPLSPKTHVCKITYVDGTEAVTDVLTS